MMRFSGNAAKKVLTSIIHDLDAGRVPTWARRLAVPVAVGMTMGIASCDNEPSEAPVSKGDAAAGKADGYDLCTWFGGEPGCDICEELGWYGDGECDTFCPQPDIMDCAALYGVPFESDCHDDFDNDYDGAVDCCDSDCQEQPGECVVACPRYMAPLTEDVCGDCVDNDCDGHVDCDDADCVGDPLCGGVAPEDCHNGIDDDQDGLTDCCDNDCQEAGECVVMCPRYMAPLSEAACGDCVDNDCDGVIDCNDEDCSQAQECAEGN